MAERRTHSTTTYGSLAYDLDALARERRLDEAGTMPERREHTREPQRRTRTSAQARPKASPVVLGGAAVLCAMVVVLLLGFVQLTKVSGSVSALKSDIALLTDENVSLTTNYERTFDLATIKAVAEANGMSKPSSGQIEYIDLGGKDSTVVYADTASVTGRLTGSVEKAAGWLWEYFR